jgi:hypothetical protein
MALKPENEAHGFQIEAGTVGRKCGHAFEKRRFIHHGNRQRLL